MKRIRSKFDEMSLTYHYNFIEYKDFSKYSGKKSLFQKDVSYSYQQEFRFLIKSEFKIAMNIEIGSLEDISKIISVNNDNMYTCEEFI
jgi:hypothetical protein